MQTKPYTLDDYNKQILHPFIIGGIKAGQFDHVLLDRDVLNCCDDEMFDAIIERLKVLNAHSQTHNQA